MMLHDLLRKRRLLIGGILSFLLTFEAALADQACQDTLEVALPHLPPYSVYENDSVFKGQDVRLLKRVSELSGCELIFKPLPWKRGLKLLQQDKVDVIIMASWREKRTEFGQYTLPYRWESQVIMARNNFPTIDRLTSMASLIEENFLVGSVRGAYHGEEYKELFEYGPGQKLVRDITDYEHAITLMQKGRIDGIISDAGGFRYISEKAGYRDYKFLQFPVYRNKVHFLLSRSVKKTTLASINKAIDEIMKSEEYFSIFGPENVIQLQDQTVVN